MNRMTAAEKVHYWILKYEITNGTPPKPKEISAQLEMAIENEKQALSIANVSQQRELLAAFVKDWYKDNPMVDESKQLKMVDKFLAAYSG